MHSIRSVVMCIIVIASVCPTCHAQSAESSDFFDDFVELLVHPADGAYWWTRNLGDNHIFEDQPCAEDSCITVQEQNGVTFADFVLFPDEQPDDYTNVELSEYPTGYAYGQDGLWLPTPGHPVIMETRVRLVGDFHQDGSGNAIGTAGIGLWNSPVQYPTSENPAGEFNPQTLIGFNWATDANPIAKGLAATILRNNFPFGVKKPSFQIDMDDWITMKMVWQENDDTGQEVSFWINGNHIGTVELSVPQTQPLTLTIWHDNQSYQFSGPTFQNPVEKQSFQVDYVHILQG